MRENRLHNFVSVQHACDEFGAVLGLPQVVRFAETRFHEISRCDGLTGEIENGT
jgi:hypothetical protein